jgi:hypothetical protein
MSWRNPPEAVAWLERHYDRWLGLTSVVVRSRDGLESRLPRIVSSSSNTDGEYTAWSLAWRELNGIASDAIPAPDDVGRVHMRPMIQILDDCGE